MGVLAALAGTAAALLTGGSRPGVDPSPAGTALSAPAPGQGPVLDVLVDGWSMRTVSGRSLVAEVNGSRVPLTMRPLDSEDVAALTASSPGLARQAFARLVTDDPSLTCTAQGCTAAGRALGPQLLAQPSSVPGLGPVYAGWKVDAGLYAARVAVPDVSADVQVGVDGWQFTRVSLVKGSKPTRVLVSAGLGRFFPPAATWLGGGSDPVRYEPAPAAQTPQDAAAVLAATRPVLSAPRGLAQPLAVAKDWTVSHLTYATSPTTGCGPEALCAPALLNVGVKPLAFDAVTACTADGDRAAVGVEQQLVSARLPAPVHQFGLGGGRWGAAPELASGVLSYRSVVAALFTGDPQTHRAAGGRIDRDAAGSVPAAEPVTAVRFAGERWRTC